MIRPSIAIITALMCLEQAPAQGVELSVRDLLTSPAAIPASGHWIDHLRAPGWEHGSAFTGESALTGDASPAAFFTAEDLVAVLAKLARLDVDRLDVDAGVLLVSPDDAAGVREGLLWVRQHLPPYIDVEFTLERLGADRSTVLLRAAQSLRAGSTAILSDLVTQPIVRDFDVEIAQSAASANPVVDMLMIGTCLAVRPRVLPDRETMLLEVVARIAERAEAEPVATMHPGFGEIDRAARDIDECGVSFLLRRGADSVHEWTSRDGQQLRLSCKVSWQAPSPGPRRDVVIRCSSLLNKPVLAFGDLIPYREETSEESEYDSLAGVVEGALRGVDAGSLMIADTEAGSGKLVLVGSTAVAVEERVVRAVAGALVPVQVEILAFDLASGSRLDPTKTPDGRRIARITGSVLAGKWATFAGGTEMLYLRDWDTEVAQSARIPDPKVDVLIHGYRIGLQVTTGGTGQIDGLSLDARFDRLVRIDAARVPLNLPMQAGGAPAKDASTVSPTLVLSQDVVGIEKPVLRRHAFTNTLPLDGAGRAVLRRTAPRLLGPGRDLVLLVRATPGS